jgi:nucleoside-diphosphate-sugar epimerase
MRLLVAGINGFLGRTVAQQALAAGWCVDGVVRAARECVPDGVDRVVGIADLCTLPAPDAIINTAAFIPHGAMDVPDRRLYETNVALAAELAAGFPAARHLYVSSVAVFGHPAELLREASSSDRPSLYGASKLAGELATRCFAPHSAVIRMTSLYGRGMHPSTLVPRYVEQARASGRIRVYGDGSRRQDYLHVDDAARLCLRAVERPAVTPYLGVSGWSVANIQIARWIAEVVPGVAVVAEGADTSPSWTFDATTTWNSLNLCPERDLEQGIKELVRA